MNAAPTESESTRLSRGLGLSDAVFVGLGAMIGAGVFTAFAPAARAAGNALVIGLLVAAIVAFCNARSSAALAAKYPESGGAYVYGRERLGDFWGFIAGFSFVVGKLASCAAMAMTFGAYAWPEHARALATGAVVALTALNCVGISKSAFLTRALVVMVLLALAVALVSVGVGDAWRPSRLWPLDRVDARSVLGSAGFLFFAFAGYARIATLGEEVRAPRTTIPRAIHVSLAVAFLVYAAVAVSTLGSLGARALAASDAPLAAAVGASAPGLVPVVRGGAAVASLSALLSLILGVSRTIFAMASRGDLPSSLAIVHARYRVPHRAELCVGAIVALVVAFADVRGAIGFSAFGVLTYYGIANASAWTLPDAERGMSRAIPALGMLGCIAIAASLPLASIASGTALLGLGAATFLLRARR